jgi:diguanylate cyclase (GGDEF)-like protein
MAVLFIDIDEFKHINDTFGHAGGDCVLKTMAQRIHQALRKYDWLPELLAMSVGCSLWLK